MQSQDDSLEYEIDGSFWRVNRPKLLFRLFPIDGSSTPAFHKWVQGRPDLAASWQVARMLFGIEPTVQDENADASLYTNALSIDDIAELRKCSVDEVKIELECLSAAWKVYCRTAPPVVQQQQPLAVQVEPVPVVVVPETPVGPLTGQQLDLLRYRGFSREDFTKMDKHRPTEKVDAEMQYLYGRLVELRKVFDEPMAKEFGRQALINEILLRRIDDALLGLEPSGQKFAILRETKGDIEATLIKQWAKIDEICPFVKGALNKQTAIGAISDLIKGEMEWGRDQTHHVFDGLFTLFEFQTEMRQSQQLGPSYRPGWVAAMLEARAGLYDPNFRRKMSNSKCQILDAAFQAANKAFNDKHNVKLPDLLLEGKGGDYPELILPEPPDDESTMEIANRETVDSQLAETSEQVEMETDAAGAKQ